MHYSMGFTESMRNYVLSEFIACITRDDLRVDDFKNWRRLP